MTFQADHSQVQAPLKSSGNGGLWRTTLNQFLWRTFSVMMVSFILVLAWESMGPLTSNLGFPPDTQKTIQFNFGEAAKAHALWVSMEQLQGSGKPMRSDPWKVIDELNTDLESSHDSGRRLGGALDSLVVEPNDGSMMTRTEPHPPDPPPLNLSTRSNELEAAKPMRLTNSLSTGNSSTSGSEPTANMHSNELIELKASRSKRKVCDLTRGYWVKDEQRPFYSGKKCKAYLSDGFSCRGTNRPNFDYEKLRWQPEDCDLPSFTGDGFLRRLRNKVVAFVGDSLGRQQFQSLMCMITQGKDDKRVEDVQKDWGPDVKWAYRFRSTNTTILFYWSASLCEIEGGNPNERPGYFAMHLDRPAGFLKDYLDKLDLVILNTGHHWNRGKLDSNKWHPYVGGKPFTERKLAQMGEALNFTVHKVIQWLDAKLADDSRQKQHPTVFLRTLSPRHFKNGEWDSGGTCDGTQFLPKEEEKVVPPQRAYKGPITEKVAENAVKGTRVKLLNITYLSKFREEGHISKYGKGKDSKHQDCLHWCLPGVPDVWNELLYGNLVSDPSLSPL